MPKRLTIADVKDFLNKYDINQDCELISTEYKNVSTPLEFKCNSCGKIFYRDFGHLKQRKKFKCQNCVRHDAGKACTINDVRNFIREKDKNNYCTLLSTEYINYNSPLQFKCNKCGNLFERDFAHLKRGEGRFQCPSCGILQGAQHKKYTEEDVKEKIGEKGYLMTSIYIDADTPFEVKCKNNHQTTLIFSKFLCGKSGCRKCAALANRGENHYNWKGGESEIIDYLRKSLKNWKFKVLKRDNFKCVISHTHDNLVVHHLKSFNTIVQEASEELGIPILRKLSDYEKLDDFYALQEKVIQKHTLDIGITLNRDIHNSFHNKYGKGDNTVEQFNEFKALYK